MLLNLYATPVLVDCNFAIDSKKNATVFGAVQKNEQPRLNQEEVCFDKFHGMF